jgi:subtilisin family serine protease
MVPDGSHKKLEVSEADLRARPIPGFIVLFRSINEKNVELLARIRHVTARAELGNQIVLDAKEPGGAFTRIFTRIGAAATDLTDVEKAELENSEEVLRVVPNQLRRLPHIEGQARAVRNASSIDPAGSAQSSVTWALSMIGIDEQYTYASGRGVGVAVLDTGLELEHPDFGGRIDPIHTKAFGSSISPRDGNGHGTHCAGIVAGPKISAGGVRFGVAPDVNLFIGKVLNDSGCGYDDWILQGIQWAVELGVRIVSISISGDRKINEPPAVLYQDLASQLLGEDPGCLLIAAAGNSSQRPSRVSPIGDPAACDSVIAVSAIDAMREIAVFSCGAVPGDAARVDFTAPGVDVRSSWLNGTFEIRSGTSMAVPHVAGIAALILEHQPNLRATELWKSIADLAEDLGNASNFGRGLVRVPGRLK